MTAQIVSLKFPLRWSRDWSQQELAEFYRVESALIQAGLSLETERGLSDEGDPWFTFCRTDNGEVFIHFARIDGEYVIDGGPFDQVVRGSSFAELVRDLIGRQPLAQARARGKSNVFLHPAALLIALVGSAFFHSGEAKAAESSPEHTRADLRRQLVLILSGPAETVSGAGNEAAQAATILAGVIIGLNQPGTLQPPAVSGPSSAETGAMLAPPTFTTEGRAAQTNAPPAPPPPQSPAGALAPEQHALALSMANAPLAPSPPAPSAAGGAAPPQLLALHHDLIPLPAPPVVTPAPPPGQVEAAMEQTDAAQAIQVIQGVIQFNPGDAPQLLKLPATLTTTISEGKHVGSDSPPPLPSTPGLDPSIESATTNVSVGSATASIAAATPSASALSSSSPASSATTPSSARLLDPHDPAVAAAVNTFVHEIQTTDVVTSGHDIVIYDGAIMDTKIITPLESITFHFSDGSSLSLVGTTGEIYALHYGG